MTEDVLMDFARLQNDVIRFQGEALRILYNLATVRIPQLENTLLSMRSELIERMDNLAGAAQDIQDAISLLNQETDNLAARIMAIQAQLESGVTPEQATVIGGQLGQIAGRLRQLAATPEVVPGGPTPPDQPLNVTVHNPETAGATSS